MDTGLPRFWAQKKDGRNLPPLPFIIKKTVYGRNQPQKQGLWPLAAASLSYLSTACKTVGRRPFAYAFSPGDPSSRRCQTPSTTP